MSQPLVAKVGCDRVQQILPRLTDDEDVLQDFARAAFGGDLVEVSPVLSHVTGCSLCQGRVTAAVHIRLQGRQDEAEQRLHGRAIGETVLRWISHSKPFHDGLAFRWPEIDALGTHLEELPWHESNHLLGLLLRDALCLPRALAPRVSFFREYLKSRISSSEDGFEQLAHAYLAGDVGREQAIAREVELQQAFDHPAEVSEDEAKLASAAWRHAAIGLQRLGHAPSGGPALDRFRGAVAVMLYEYSSNDLTTRVIAPLEQMGWEISVYRPDASGTVLEVVGASDPTFAYTVHHPVASITPDIEVDVFRRQRAERVHGQDPRLNQYIFRRFNHARYTDRLFIPVILVKTLPDVTAPCRWQRVGESWEPVVPKGAHKQAVGNLSLSRMTRVDLPEIERALDFAGNEAAKIMHRTSLSGLCERLLAELMREFGASHGAIHVASDVDGIFERANPSAVRAAAVKAVLEGGVAETPRRQGGIGHEAIEQDRCVHYCGTELAQKNESLWAQGIKATWAAPLYSANGARIGVVYLHFSDEDGGTNFEPYARCLGWALGEALNVREHQLERAHILTEAKGFARPLNESVDERLTNMAEFVHNLLGCDHVSIRTTLPGDRPAHAGRFITDANKRLLLPALRKLTLPAGLVHWHGESLERDPRGDFVAAEKIETVVLLPLRDSDIDVGFLVMDYRRHYDPEPDREWLDQLATLLAAGVRVGSSSREALDEMVARAENALSDFTKASPPWVRSQKGASGGGFRDGQWVERH